MEKNPKLEKTSCPECKSKLDAATNIGLEKIQPKAGDFTVCMYCSEILIYKSNFLLRKSTEADLKKLDKETLSALIKAKIITKMFPKKKQNLFPKIS